VLGAAAFLIAEFLKISYLDVIRMAVIPTILFYLSLFVMVELDARRFHSAMVGIDADRPWTLIRRHGYHFISLVAVIAFMVVGFSPMLSVFWATVLALGTSYLRRDTALTPRRLVGRWPRARAAFSASRRRAPRRA
jgi:TRAP-type uncharacterized transport system fused permease subunit